MRDVARTVSAVILAFSLGSVLPIAALAAIPRIGVAPTHASDSIDENAEGSRDHTVRDGAKAGRPSLRSAGGTPLVLDAEADTAAGLRQLTETIQTIDGVPQP